MGDLFAQQRTEPLSEPLYRNVDSPGTYPVPGGELSPRAAALATREKTFQLLKEIRFCIRGVFRLERLHGPLKDREGPPLLEQLFRR